MGASDDIEVLLNGEPLEYLDRGLTRKLTRGGRYECLDSRYPRGSSVKMPRNITPQDPITWAQLGEAGHVCRVDGSCDEGPCQAGVCIEP